MLTRLEITGFKSFSDFSLDLAPLTVIAGTNASGKSNLFDAIQLLAALSDGDLRSALTTIRGEPHELFTRASDGSYSPRMTFAAEVLVEPRIRDSWGQEQDLIHTRLRYEVSIERRIEANGFERMFIASESATPIRVSDDHWAQWLKPSREFKQHHLLYKRQPPYLETEFEAQAFRLHRDGTAGRVRMLPAVAAEATVLSSITTAEFGHLLALREELRSWRFLQLDPVALREPASYQSPDRLEPSGANLAAVLARLKAETAEDEDDLGVVADLSADMARLIPGLVGVNVHDDSTNRRWETMISTRDEAPFNARVASDGTLRILALLTALSDPDHGGVVAFEEPENGVHPGRLEPLVKHLRSLVSRVREAEVPEVALLQLLVTTHSPVVVAALAPNEGVYFDATTVTSAPEVRRTRSRRIEREQTEPIFPTERIREVIPAGEVTRYLAGVAA